MPPWHAGKTHRELFDDWVQSLLGRSAPSLIAEEREPEAARVMFERMSADIAGCGGEPGCPLTAAAYALGYNLAIEFLADFEKRWMLDSFRDMHDRYMAAQGVTPDWVFLEVRHHHAPPGLRCSSPPSSGSLPRFLSPCGTSQGGLPSLGPAVLLTAPYSLRRALSAASMCMRSQPPIRSVRSGPVSPGYSDLLRY